jgi:hypothetical protein
MTETLDSQALSLILVEFKLQGKNERSKVGT